MSKNIVAKPIAIKSIEVWMSKDNFLREWFLNEYFWNHEKGVYNIKSDSAMHLKQIFWEQTWEVSSVQYIKLQKNKKQNRITEMSLRNGMLLVLAWVTRVEC